MNRKKTPAIGLGKVTYIGRDRGQTLPPLPLLGIVHPHLHHGHSFLVVHNGVELHPQLIYAVHGQLLSERLHQTPFQLLLLLY